MISGILRQLSSGLVAAVATQKSLLPRTNIRERKDSQKRVLTREENTGGAVHSVIKYQLTAPLS